MGLSLWDRLCNRMEPGTSGQIEVFDGLISEGGVLLMIIYSCYLGSLKYRGVLLSGDLNREVPLCYNFFKPLSI